MFIDRLTTEQRQALFDLAAILAAADGEVSEEEAQYLKDFSQRFDLVMDLDKSHLDLADLLRVMDSQASKIITLQELIRISYKDGHFGEQEQDKVFQIAQLMGLNDPELMLRVEKWVREGFNWVYEGEQMLASS